MRNLKQRLKGTGYGFLPAYSGNRLFYWFSCTFLVLMSYLVVASFVFPNSDIIAYRPAIYFLLAEAAALGGWGVLRLGRRFAAWPAWKRSLLVAILLCLLLPLQYILFKSVYYQPGWDVSILTESGYWLALEMGIPTNFMEYFACYPNNVTLLMVWAYMTKALIHFFGYYDYLLAAIMLSAVMCNLALFFAFQTADRWLSPAKGLFCLYLGLPLVAFAPWIVNPYSDTMSILFPILTLYLFFRARETQRRWLRVCLYFFAGAGAGFGFMIKPTVAIVLVAILLAGLFCAKHKEELPHFAKAFAVVALGFLLLYLPLQQLRVQVMERSGVTQAHIEEVKYPATHFLMMGMQKQPSPFTQGQYQYGKWYARDCTTTYSASGQQAKIQTNIAVIQTRLQEFGPGGYLRFLSDKGRWILGDGTMYFGGEVPTDGCFQQGPLAMFLQQFFWKNGEFYDATAYVMQAFWLLTLSLCCLPLIHRKDDYTAPLCAVARLSVFGILLFVLLFEGRARYLINYLPVFFVLAAYGTGVFVSQAPQPAGQDPAVASNAS